MVRGEGVESCTIVETFDMAGDDRTDRNIAPEKRAETQDLADRLTDAFWVAKKEAISRLKAAGIEPARSDDGGQRRPIVDADVVSR